MKKLKKTPILLVAISSLLTSCSTTIAGTYGFQLGKDKGTHFGIYITLKDAKYKNNTPETEIDPRAKKCTFKFSFNLGNQSEDPSEQEDFLSVLSSILGDEAKFNGYYYENGKPAKDGTTELKIGVDFSFIKDLFDDEDTPDTDFPVIEPDYIEKIVYTTYKNAVVTLNIPVSEVDVLYQLYWYGIDITYTEEEGIKITEFEEPERIHAPGTHPTEADITTINETYNFKAEHEEFAKKYGINMGSYRDYYTLAMGLVKN